MDYVFLYLILCLLFLVLLITPSNVWLRQCFEGLSRRPRIESVADAKKEE